MKHIQISKFASAVDPVSLSDATATGNEIDASGFAGALFVFSLGVTDGNMDTIKIQSATTSGGSFTDIPSGALADGDMAPGDDGKVFGIFVDLTDKTIGQYLKVVLTEDSTGSALVSCLCILTESAQTITSAADRGFETEAFA